MKQITYALDNIKCISMDGPNVNKSIRHKLNHIKVEKWFPKENKKLNIQWVLKMRKYITKNIKLMWFKSKFWNYKYNIEK